MDFKQILTIFDKHHRMELFSFSVMVIVVLMMLLSLISCKASFDKNKGTISDKALYTETFETSRTQIKGTVEGVYSSEDHTRALVLLKFDDVAKVSTDAKDYQIFMTGADVTGNSQVVTGTPSAAIYVFGESGYLGLYLTDADGFAAQVLEITVRCNAELVAAQNVNDKEIDGSFKTYDQFRLYVNPGGAKAKHLKSLDAETPKAEKIYREAVVGAAEDEIKETLVETLTKMDTELTRMNSDMVKLNQAGIKTPDAPAGIDGDVVKMPNDKGGEPSLSCAIVDYGGFDFKWQGLSLTKGDSYLKQVLPASIDSNDDTAVLQWITQYQSNGDADSASVEKVDYGQEISRWSSDMDARFTTLDGVSIGDLNVSTSTNGTSKYRQVSSIISDTQDAMNSYWSLKTEYQKHHLLDLLMLEVDVANVASSTSVNAGEDIITIY